MLSDPRSQTARHPLARFSPAAVSALIAGVAACGGWIGYTLAQGHSSASAPVSAAAKTPSGLHLLGPDAPEAAPVELTDAEPEYAAPVFGPDGQPPTILQLLEGKGEVSADHFEALLTSTTPLGGPVQKFGMLSMDRWVHKSGDDSPTIPNMCRLGMCDVGQYERAWKWAWHHTVGRPDGALSQLPLGEIPPHAAVCTVLFNPVYKVIFIKSTKIGGSSLVQAMGGICPVDITYEFAKDYHFCFWNNHAMMRAGLDTLGYGSWEELWADYTVFTMIRNPYDRAGSSYDYIVGRHTRKEGTCAAPSFELFTSKPYVLGLQDMLFDCGDAIHDFYHTEPQGDCLLDPSGRFVADYVIRLENLNEDFDGLLEILNARKPDDQPPLEADIGWKQQGPLVKPGRFGGKKSEMNDSKNRHLFKYEQCGTRCFDYARLYYAQDFEVLGYPAVLQGAS